MCHLIRWGWNQFDRFWVFLFYFGIWYFSWVKSDNKKFPHLLTLRYFVIFGFNHESIFLLERLQKAKFFCKTLLSTIWLQKLLWICFTDGNCCWLWTGFRRIGNLSFRNQIRSDRWRHWCCRPIRIRNLKIRFSETFNIWLITKRLTLLGTKVIN